MTVILPLLLCVFPALVIVAALKDVTSFTIPNWISIALALAFAPAAFAGGMALGDVGLHLAVGFAALVAGIAMFALRWIGGGDAKLFAASSLWLGLAPMPTFLMMSGLGGAAARAQGRRPLRRGHRGGRPGRLSPGRGGPDGRGIKFTSGGQYLGRH